MINIIVGKRSNLSIHLQRSLSNTILVSSSDLRSQLKRQKISKKFNLILNNFHPAIKLNDVSEPKTYVENSIGSTAEILENILPYASMVNKLIYTSSSSVYGNVSSTNEDMYLQPISLHASLKLSNEKLIEQFCKSNAINFLITRIFNMFGGVDKFSIISKIINAAEKNSNLCLINDGEAIRDFISINDVVHIYDILTKNKSSGKLNIASGRGTSIKSILSFLKENSININYKSIYKEEIATSIGINQKLLSIIGEDYKFVNVENYLLMKCKK